MKRWRKDTSLEGVQEENRGKRWLGDVLHRVIQNNCRGFNNLSYTKHLRYEYMYFFLFNRTTLQVFVTYLTGALYVHPL